MFKIIYKMNLVSHKRIVVIGGELLREASVSFSNTGALDENRNILIMHIEIGGPKGEEFSFHVPASALACQLDFLEVYEASSGSIGGRALVECAFKKALRIIKFDLTQEQVACSVALNRLGLPIEARCPRRNDSTFWKTYFAYRDK